MTANVKRFRRRDEAVELLERHLEIERLFAPHNFPVAKFGFVWWHRFFKFLSKNDTRDTRGGGRPVGGKRCEVGG